jgi:hypothetical protein
VDKLLEQEQKLNVANPPKHISQPEVQICLIQMFGENEDINLGNKTLNLKYEQF